jgi:hypothetical protein
VTERHGVTVFTISDIGHLRIEGVARGAPVTDLFDRVYLVVDVDVLDSAFVPGASGPEIGGMTGPELLRGHESVAAFVDHRHGLPRDRRYPRGHARAVGDVTAPPVSARAVEDN